jgi:hypothetical protein
VSSLDDIVSRLEQIDEELADLAIDRLKTSVVDNDAGAAAEEKRITRARRQVEKAAGILAGLPSDD